MIDKSQICKIKYGTKIVINPTFLKHFCCQHYTGWLTFFGSSM